MCGQYTWVHCLYKASLRTIFHTKTQSNEYGMRLVSPCATLSLFNSYCLLESWDYSVSSIPQPNCQFRFSFLTTNYQLEFASFHIKFWKSDKHIKPKKYRKSLHVTDMIPRRLQRFTAEEVAKLTDGKHLYGKRNECSILSFRNKNLNHRWPFSRLIFIGNQFISNFERKLFIPTHECN